MKDVLNLFQLIKDARRRYNWERHYTNDVGPNNYTRKKKNSRVIKFCRESAVLR